MEDLENMDTPMGNEVVLHETQTKKNDAPAGEDSRRVALQVSLLEHQKDNAISPLKEQDKKRPRVSSAEKMEGDPKNSIRSALSFEEGDREQ